MDSLAESQTLVLIVGLALLGLVAVLLTLLVAGRRRLDREVRETLGALEQLRSGTRPTVGDADPHSPLALINDSVNRLGQDMLTRTHTAEQAEEQFRALLEAVKDSAVIATDIDGDIRSFSDGAAELLGWEEHEVRAQPASVVFEESAFKDFLPKLARRTLRERGIRTRSTLRRRDGTTFTADMSVSMLRGTTGEASGFLMVARDATEQADLESRLRESEQRYRSLVDGLSQGVVIVRGGRLIYVNAAFADWFGLRPEQLEGTPLRDRLATRDMLWVEERLAGVESGGPPEELSCKLSGASGGGTLRAGLQASAIEDHGQRAVLVVVRDETLEQRMTEELRRNESQLDAVLEATTDGLLVLVRKGSEEVVQITNRAFLERFELTRTRILGLSGRVLLRKLRVAGKSGGAVAAFLERPGSGEARRIVDLEDPHKSTFELHLSPLRSRSGVLFGRVLAARDLTAQRETESQLQEQAERLQLSKIMLEQAYQRLESLHKELHSRSEDLRKLNEELRTLDRMKSNLLGNVSHELQTPLVSIRGYTEMIIKGRLGPVSDEQRRGLELSLKNIDRLIAMIDNLLAFSRSRPEQIQLSRFPLSPLIEEVRRLLATRASERQIRISADVQDPAPRIQGDRDRIQQVFINLLSNAIKFNRHGGEVAIEVRDGKPGYAEVSIRDTGEGIPADALNRVFERSFQVRRDPDAPVEGSGLGLSIVRDILRLHGCVIDVESQEGQGSVFRFTLPLAGEAESAAGHDVEIKSDDAEGPPIESVARPEIIETPEPQAPEVEQPEPESKAEPAQPEAPARAPRFRIIRRRSG